MRVRGYGTPTGTRVRDTHGYGRAGTRAGTRGRVRDTPGGYGTPTGRVRDTHGYGRAGTGHPPKLASGGHRIGWVSHVTSHVTLERVRHSKLGHVERLLYLAMRVRDAHGYGRVRGYAGTGHPPKLALPGPRTRVRDTHRNSHCPGLELGGCPMSPARIGWVSHVTCELGGCPMSPWSASATASSGRSNACCIWRSSSPVASRSGLHAGRQVPPYARRAV